MHTLSSTLLHIHRLARQFPLADFRADALSLAKPLLPFDASLWCEGAVTARTVSVEYIYASPGFRPQADVHRQAREYARLVFARRQRFAADGDSASRASGPSRAPADITLCAIHGKSQSALILGYTAEGAEFDQWIALHRVGPLRGFTPLDQRIGLDLLPHLMEAMNARRVYCAEQGGRPAVNLDSPGRDTVPISFLHNVGGGFSRLPGAKWPDWNQYSAMTTAASSQSLGDATTTIKLSLAYQAEFTASTPSPDSRLRGLTAREFEIAKLVAAGRTHKEIARLLAIAPSTVRNHIQRIHARLSVRNNVALAAMLQRHTLGKSLG